MAMSEVTVNITVGYEPQNIRLTAYEWKAIQGGAFLIKSEEGFYEGQSYTYEWHFNDPQFPQSTLVVTYDDGEGFVGSINDTWLT
jgi:hypothetical protein